MMLPHDLGSWLAPAVVSRFVLLASFGPCLGRLGLAGSGFPLPQGAAGLRDVMSLGCAFLFIEA